MNIELKRLLGRYLSELDELIDEGLETENPEVFKKIDSLRMDFYRCKRNLMRQNFVGKK